jgi:RimJ/RimL family protein N-acetyltransferase
MNIQIRNVNINDAKLLFDWANDLQSRNNSFNSNPIEWDTHVIWLTEKLESPNNHIFLFHIENIPIGVVKFEILENTTIGVIVAPQQRGKGWGSKIIRMGCEQYWSNNLHDILAYIKPENTSSIKAFEKAGFSFLRKDKYNNIPCVILMAKK